MSARVSAQSRVIGRCRRAFCALYVKSPTTTAELVFSPSTNLTTSPTTLPLLSMDVDLLQKMALMSAEERIKFFDEIDKIRHSTDPPLANSALGDPTSATAVSGSAPGTSDTGLGGSSTQPVSDGVFSVSNSNSDADRSSNEAASATHTCK